MAKDVADPAERQHQAGIGQHIADHHPLDHADRQTEAVGDRGKGDIDGGVERDDCGAQPDQHQAQPLPSGHLGRGFGLCCSGLAEARKRPVLFRVNPGRRRLQRGCGRIERRGRRAHDPPRGQKALDLVWGDNTPKSNAHFN